MADQLADSLEPNFQLDPGARRKEEAVDWAKLRAAVRVLEDEAKTEDAVRQVLRIAMTLLTDRFKEASPALGKNPTFVETYLRSMVIEDLNAVTEGL